MVFIFPYRNLTHLSACLHPQKWDLSHVLRLLPGDQLSPVRRYQAFAPVLFLHLKVTFNVQERNISVVLEVTGFLR